MRHLYFFVCSISIFELTEAVLNTYRYMCMLTNVNSYYRHRCVWCLKVITWKSSFNRLNEEYGIAKKKKQALDNLYEKGRISQSTHDSFNTEIDAAIMEIERQQKDLVQKMQGKTEELHSHIKTLEILLANYEIQYVAGEIDDNTYQLEINLLGNGLEAAKHELDTVQDAVNQLCGSSTPAPVAAPLESSPIEITPETITPAPDPIFEEKIAPVIEEAPVMEQPVAVAEAAETQTEPAAIIEQAPVIEEPVAMAPAIEQPVIEEAVIEQPVIEEAVIEQPVIEEAVIEQPVIEEAVIEQPVIEEAVIEQPVIEEAVIEQPVIEEAVIEQPVIEEAVIEQPVMEAPAIEEPVIEAAVEEVAAAEPVAEAEETAVEKIPLDQFDVAASEVVQKDLSQIVEEIIPENPREAPTAAQEDEAVETPQEVCAETQPAPIHCAKEILHEVYSDNSENKQE